MKNNNRWRRLDMVRNRLIIWGASDQCRVNCHILHQCGFQIAALIDDTVNMISPLPNVPIYLGLQGLETFLESSNAEDYGFVVAIGNPFGHVRMKLHKLMKRRGLIPVSFSDPTSLICQTVVFEEGLQVMPYAVIHNDVIIGKQCIINTRALVEHDCILNDGVEIGPGAVLCGRVNVGRNSWVGANATIRQRVTIGENSIIAAGAVVVMDIPSNVVAAGVPARVIRENLKNE